MATPPTSPTRGAGFFLAIGAIGGAIIGGRMHQATIGLLTGIAAGIAVCVALWLVDRRK
ncbi:hypothetical protein PQ455_02385 [Sphingomonas naphthae]|uniref:Glycine zipper family protein n=1 Tax=Sphingomonas naphthae TaxID=1813468 RepID=A0ABY7TPI4_9SPHN|nr:hypothetical protein [Sphingomonas naphthae]WCT74099.1 hypothetical protein PQ455_02385 [Sphingomonas naphthae]